MSKKRIRELLTQLRQELDNTDIDDDELEKLVGGLDDDIRIAIDDDEGDVDALVDRAKELEAGFATRYPTAERVMREVIDTLVRMGI